MRSSQNPPPSPRVATPKCEGRHSHGGPPGEQEGPSLDRAPEPRETAPGNKPSPRLVFNSRADTQEKPGSALAALVQVPAPRRQHEKRWAPHGEPLMEAAFSGAGWGAPPPGAARRTRCSGPSSEPRASATLARASPPSHEAAPHGAPFYG